MFNKYQNMFRSRWKAVWWAVGVCLTAYCTVPSQQQSDAQQVAAAHSGHVNPWALDKGAKN